MPILTVVVSYQGMKLRFGAVLDSGADHTTFPYDLAQAFNLDPTSGAPVTMTGVSGPVINYLHDGFKIKIAGHELELPVLFSDGLHVPLIGRNKVFEFFRVTFDGKKLTVRLDPPR